MNLNKIFLLGRLTRDPENKALPSGQSLASFGIATNRYYNAKSGQRQEQTDFHNIVLFGKLADIASQYLKKGSLVLIEGRIQTRSWEDQGGGKKYRTEVIGERIQLGPKSTERTNMKENPAEENRANSKENIPVIEEDEEINVKDIPF